MSTNKSKTGFTIVELLIVIPIALMVVTVFVQALINLTNTSESSKSAINTRNNANRALGLIERDINLSEKVLAQIDLSEIDTFQTTNSVKFGNIPRYDSANRPVHGDVNQPRIILRSVATDNNPDDTTQARSIIHQKLGQPGKCSFNPPYPINLVYFIDGAKLKRRTIMPKNYHDQICESTTWQRPSCDKKITSCRYNPLFVDDQTLLNNARMEVSYLEFLPDGNSQILTDANNPLLHETDRQKIIDQADAIQVKIEAFSAARLGDPKRVINLTLTTKLAD